VYDVTSYLDDHPAGAEIMLDCAGEDADEFFEDSGHSDDARNILKKYLIGNLKMDEAAIAKMKSQVEASDKELSDFSLAGKHVNVAMLTSGGLAPCLSSSIAQLVKYWVAAFRAGKISGLSFRMYEAGYKGVLLGKSFVLPEEHWDTCDSLNYLGGSPIGNSRVKVRM
jgi:hypothetical protein